MYSEININEYLAKTAASDPLLPAGGSSIALCAALASALTEFTANTTIGNHGYEGVEGDMIQIAQTANDYRERFVSYMDEDAEAYSSLIDAYKMSQETQEQKQTRKLQIAEQTKQATLIPLKLALDVMDLMDQIRLVLEKGNLSASGDAKTADYICRAAIQASLNNVRINLALLDDPDFSYDVIRSVHDLESKLDREI